jgi:hypothetical protein
MRQSEAACQSFDIDRPRCETCGALTWLASIEPEEPDYDRRFFECPRCQHVMIRICKYR